MVDLEQTQALLDDGTAFRGDDAHLVAFGVEAIQPLDHTRIFGDELVVHRDIEAAIERLHLFPFRFIERLERLLERRSDEREDILIAIRLVREVVPERVTETRDDERVRIEQRAIQIE